MVVFLLIVTNVCLSVGGQLLLKIGMNKVGPFRVANLSSFLSTTSTSSHIWGGLVMYGLGMVVWLVLLSKVDLSFAYPMLSLGYVLILFVSYVFLGEQITPLKALGVALIVLGVFAIFRS